MIIMIAMTMITTSNKNKGYKEKRKLHNKNEEKEVSNFGDSVKTPVKMDATLWQRYDDVRMTQSYGSAIFACVLWYMALLSPSRKEKEG